MALTTGNDDRLTKSVEKQTSKIPSIVFLGAAKVAVALSVSINVLKGRKIKPFFSSDNENLLFFY